MVEQLQWLHDTLLAAEKAGEYVHILTHIPSGHADCWTVWAREFNRIIERFNHIIGGIFSGHTHVDELNVYYTSKGHAVGVSWNGGSLTSYSNKNPNYMVYEVEPKSLVSAYIFQTHVIFIILSRIIPYSKSLIMKHGFSTWRKQTNKARMPNLNGLRNTAFLNSLLILVQPV